MEHLPCISVVVPVYDVEQYLDACIQSLINQTYSNLEIILVDDGAKDNSAAMCDKWAETDSRIRVIHQENKGLSGARNAGIEAATGPLIMFVDSDDILSPELCSTLYYNLGDADISICNPVHIFPDKPWKFSSSSKVYTMTSDDAINHLWYQTAFLPCAWAKLFRSELFTSRRFTEKRLFEDVDIMHDVFYDANTIHYNPSQLYGYVHRDNSITTTAFNRHNLDILLIADKIAAFAQDKPVLQNAARAYRVTSAMRVWLNAPKGQGFDEDIAKAKSIIDQDGKAVLKDWKIRKKNRYALFLYFTCKPLMRFVYKFVSRWR